MTKFKTKNFQEIHFPYDKNYSMVFSGEKLMMVTESYLTAEYTVETDCLSRPI